MSVKSQIVGIHRRKAIFGFLILAGAAILVIAGIGGWLGARAQVIRTEMAAASTLLPQFKNQLLAGDESGAEETLRLLQNHANSSRAAATDPLWLAASATPWIGANFSAVTELATSAVDLADGAARPLLGTIGSVSIDAFSPVNGRFDIDSLSLASPNIVAAANAVESTHDRLASIDDSILLPEVAGPLARAVAILGDSRHALSAAADASRILPDMLGAKEPRNYLVLVQNNAEVRATGGLSGALVVLRAEKGSIRITSQTSGAALGRFTPSVPVDPAQRLIYSNRLGSFIGDVNLTPDYPTVAQSAKAMWESRHGSVIDGVVALDPVVLSHILEASGPIALDSENEVTAAAGLPSTLTAGNVVQTLLSDVYTRLASNSAQDAYFAHASQEIFEALATGKTSGEKLLAALTKSASENRLHIWSSRLEDQRVLRRTLIGGDVSVPPAGGSVFGVYFNDGTGAKMDYYMRRTVQLVEVCTNSEYSDYKVKVKTTNAAPANAAASLPKSVTGDGRYGTPPGTVQTNVVVYGPAMSQLDTTVQDGLKVTFGSHLHGNRPVGVVTTRLAPGQISEIEMTFVKVVQHADPAVIVTPTVQDVGDVLLPAEVTGCQR